MRWLSKRILSQRFLKIEMRSYIIKRILVFVPTILLIAFFSFYLFKKSPDDPVVSLLNIEGFKVENVAISDYQNEYAKLAKSLNLDLPEFYFSIVPSYYPDTLHHVLEKKDKNLVTELLGEFNNWESVEAYFKSAKTLVHHLKKENDKGTRDLLFDVDLLLYKTKPKEISTTIATLEAKYKNQSGKNISLLNEHLALSKELATVDKSTIAWPKFVWHGTDSQFHMWVKNYFTGNLGKSIVDGRSVSKKIFRAFGWTASLILISIFLAVIISVPIGIWSARKDGSTLDGFVSNFFYSLYAIPVFWLATLMVVFFTTADFGSWTNIFPNVGLRPSTSPNTFDNILANAEQLILPIFCLVLTAVAYFSRLTKSSLQTESTKLYKTTTQAKGLLLKDTYTKHLFPNALLPLITIIVGVIPASLAGSLVIEVIFNIPGIGRLMYDSIFGNDWYVIFSIVMFIGIFTMIFYLIGDILYSIANPKLNFENTNKG